VNDEDKKLIEAAERLDAAATPGPWIASWDEHRCIGVSSSNAAIVGCRRYEDEEIITTDYGCYGPRGGDANFIASARTLLPQLAARLRELHEYVALLEAGIDQGCEDEGVDFLERYVELPFSDLDEATRAAARLVLVRETKK